MAHKHESAISPTFYDLHLAAVVVVVIVSDPSRLSPICISSPTQALLQKTI
jgi:hypothetical protein